MKMSGHLGNRRKPKSRDFGSAENGVFEFDLWRDGENGNSVGGHSNASIGRRSRGFGVSWISASDSGKK